MKNHKKVTYAIITTLCVVLFLIWYVKEKESDRMLLINVDPTSSAGPQTVEAIAAPPVTPEPTATPEPATPPPPTEPPPIKVYITGAVVSPGVYEIADGDRIETVLALAGGATDEADLKAVNLSLKLRDEQQIIIPVVGENIDPLPENPADNTPAVQEAPAEQPDTGTADGKIDINTAGKDALMTLPGVGEVIAEAIIAYRETNGAFQSAEELKNVYRIGDKTFERFKDDIVITGGAQ